jgi:hypothetical protein
MNPLQTTGLDPHRGTTALSVNLNKVALLRNTRTLGIPSVTRAATIAWRRVRRASRSIRGPTSATSARQTSANSPRS